MATTNAIGNQVTVGNFTIGSGNLLLPTTSSTVGQIQINAARWAHAFGTNNTFVGTNAGNLTLSGANSNTGFGEASLAGLTSGDFNVCAGHFSGAQISSGSNNTFIGHGSGYIITTQSNNTALGFQSLAQSTGANNVAIGLQAGYNYNTTEANNICIGYTVTGTAAESNVLRIGQGTGVGAGNLNKAVIAGIYNKAVGATAGMVLIDSTDVMGSVPYTASTAWTPALKFGGASVDMTYGTQTGSYCRTGGVVTFTMNIVLTAKGSSAGAATITGLPVAAGAKTAVAAWYSVLTFEDGDVNCYVSASTIYIEMNKKDGSAAAALTDAAFANTTALTISGTYIV